MDEAAELGSGGGLEGQTTEQSPQHTGAGHAAQLTEGQRRKAEATRIARAALAGVELVRLADGTWIASRWGMVKPLADSEVDAWLQRVGAPA